MHTHRRTRRALAGFLAATVVATTALFGGSSASAIITTSSPPVVMAGLGDSITQAIMTCSSLSTCAANSWSTGTTASVGSHASKFRATNPALVAHTNAVSGANSSGLFAQAQKAVTQGATYVTIEIGANDACTRTVSAMTTKATFETNVRKAMAELTKNPVKPEIFIASVPNLMRMYEVNWASSSARLTWGLLQVCQSMLANPTSTKPADIQRRTDVQKRVIEYNDVLRQVCSEYATCRFDGGAVYNFRFEKTHISTRDYFHPSLAGQTALAAVTWPLTQWVS